MRVCVCVHVCVCVCVCVCVRGCVRACVRVYLLLLLTAKCCGLPPYMKDGRYINPLNYYYSYQCYYCSCHCYKIQHIKRSKERLFIMTQTHNLQIFEVIPLYQATKRHLNNSRYKNNCYYYYDLPGTPACERAPWPSSGSARYHQPAKGPNK